MKLILLGRRYSLRETYTTLHKSQLVRVVTNSLNNLFSGLRRLTCPRRAGRWVVKLVPHLENKKLNKIKVNIRTGDLIYVSRYAKKKARYL